MHYEIKNLVSCILYNAAMAEPSRKFTKSCKICEDFRLQNF